MRHLDMAVARLAAGQHSLVTLGQLRDVGATRRQVRTRIDREQWSMVDSSVIRINGAPVTWESQVLAAVLGAGEGALASHRTAAALWGLEGCRRGVPEISIARGHTYRRTGVRVHQSTDLDRTTATVLNGIPTTLVARTLLDLGAVVPLSKVHVALDYARRKSLTNWNVLLDTLVVHARRGRDGVGTSRAILDEHFGEVAKTDSGFERLVAIALCEAGLPAPVLQHEIRTGGRVYRLDLAYPDEMVAIELDGGHHLDRTVWEADHVKQNALINAGWTVLRFTWRDYTQRRIALIDDVKTALRRTTPRN
jgi:very-short-patch-repair endonuclease